MMHYRRMHNKMYDTFGVVEDCQRVFNSVDPYIFNLFMFRNFTDYVSSRFCYMILKGRPIVHLKFVNNVE